MNLFDIFESGDQELDENLRKWFKDKWVRFGPDGEIRGDCARGDDSEGKPKCLPQSKAHSLGKKGRKYAAAKKRREDPNPERRGPAKNVATKKKSNEGVAEGTDEQLSVHQLATISDEALDKAYGYGRSSPGNTFGWQANLKSAAYAKQMIDKGVTDIEIISDAIHKGWNVTAKAFVQDPDQFADTEKLRAAGKLEAKLAQRKKLMNIDYSQLPDDEQEKDRVVARALLSALKGQQGVAEGSDIPQWRVEQSDATGRYYIVSGYSDKSRKVWKSKLGAIDFVKKADAEAKAQELNQSEVEGKKHEISTTVELPKWQIGMPVYVKHLSQKGIIDTLGKDSAIVTVGMRQYRVQLSDLKRYSSKSLSEEQLDELKCWPGYHRVKGTKAGFPGSCAKNKTNEEVSKKINPDAVRRIQQLLNNKFDANLDVDGILGPLTLKSIKKFLPKSAKKQAPDSSRTTAVQGKKEKCPHCGGEMVSEELINEKKDACYYKVKSRYKVWPSAYASGALVKCRKKGAKNWGNKSKGVAEARSPEEFMRQMGKIVATPQTFEVGDWVTIDPNETSGYASSGMIGRIVELYDDEGESMAKIAVGGGRGVQTKMKTRGGTTIGLGKGVRSSGTHTAVPTSVLQKYDPQGVTKGLDEMDKTQTSPGRDGDIDWTKKQIHLGPEHIIKAKDVAKHALKALDKSMKKSHADAPKKKGVTEGTAQDESEQSHGWVADSIDEINYNTFEVHLTNTRSGESADLVIRPVDMMRISGKLQIETIDVRDLATGATQSWTTEMPNPQGAIVDAIDALFWDNPKLNKKLYAIVDAHSKKGQDMLPGQKNRAKVGMATPADQFIAGQDAIAKAKGTVKEFDAQGFQQRYTLYKDSYEIEKFGDMDDAIEYAEDDRRDGDDPSAVYKIVDINKQVVWDSNPYEKPSRTQFRKPDQGVAEGLPQTLRKVVPGYAKREIDKKMDAGKFGKTDADKDANFQRYKKIQDKIKEQGVAEDQVNEKWTKKYKDSINCSNPKGFSQKAHCAGKKKNEDITEGKEYYTVTGTDSVSLRRDFNMSKDRNGWYLKEGATPKQKLEALRAFGSPKLKEYNLAAFSGGTQTKGDDNVISPVGSQTRGQYKK